MLVQLHIQDFVFTVSREICNCWLLRANLSRFADILQYLFGYLRILFVKLLRLSLLEKLAEVFKCRWARILQVSFEGWEQVIFVRLRVWQPVCSHFV